MILYVIRHGKPDYLSDSLTDEGKHQAELLAERMKISRPNAIYSSPLGRARETASYTADALGLPVTVLNWARELSSQENRTCFPDGQLHRKVEIPATHWAKPEYRKLSIEDAFSTIEGLSDLGYRERYYEISAGLDELLAKHGYERTPEGFYQPVRPNDDHVALFCHAGMGRIVFSHLLNIPPQFLVASLFGMFTGVTTFGFRSDRTEPVPAVLHEFGSQGHLYLHGEGPSIEPESKAWL